MRTRCVIKALLFCTFALLWTACGGQPEPVYDEELKDYGQSKDSEGIGKSEIQQPIIPGAGGAGGPVPLPMPGPGDKRGDDGPGRDGNGDNGNGNNNAGGTGNGNGTGGGSADDDGDDGDDGENDGGGGTDGIIIGDDGEDDGDGGIVEPPPIPPETLISSNWYRAYFDVDSAYGIRDGSGIRYLGQIEDPVKEKLTNEPGDGVVISQTFGDGVSTSLNSQNISNSAGDTNRDAGAPTVSGVQYMDRVVTPECPGVFLCISRMWFEPVEGDVVTYCYTDPETNEPALFPYGPMPNYKAIDFDPYYGEYGPYRVSKYQGQVSCDDPGAALLSEDVLVTISPETLDDVNYELHVYEPMLAQYSISFANTRAANDLQSPYVDETVQLNRQSKYVLNEDSGEIVKMVVTSRQSIDVAAEAGGGAFGRWIANLLNIQGIIVDLHFELCNNLLDEGSTPHCDAPYGPILSE